MCFFFFMDAAGCRCIFIHPVASVGLYHSVQLCYALWLFRKDWFPTFATWRTNLISGFTWRMVKPLTNSLHKLILFVGDYWFLLEILKDLFIFERHSHESNEFFFQSQLFLFSSFGSHILRHPRCNIVEKEGMLFGWSKQGSYNHIWAVSKSLSFVDYEGLIDILHITHIHVYIYIYIYPVV